MNYSLYSHAEFFPIPNAANCGENNLIPRLLMIAGITACIGGALPEIYTSPALNRSRSDVVGTNSNTGFSVAYAENSQIELDAIARNLKQEILASKQILGLIHEEPDSDQISCYLESISRACNLFEEQKSSQPVDAMKKLALMLFHARSKLLDEFITAKQWIKFARAIDPEGELHLPRRFILPSISIPSIEIDEGALSASAWMQSAFS
ncbi:hypothetical protein HW932_19950 [Allochromatium humboldtianum]|uniref:Uncharacterized protein n=1 Tax=Allochromatium humboldtianum TaxID=504901 RepID=A0A850RJ56_9GAMM|nr:hypothetical protein [Allochromatium humboldtianum]NVZ11527.1 hypothetical protein [Allochromatium humboldtianum]